MKRQTKRQKRGAGELGATAVEFAIVAPVLLLLLGSLAETGAFILVQTQLQFATDAAARQVRIGRVGPVSSAAGMPNQMSLGDFKTLICSEMVLSNCSATLRVDVQSDTSFAKLKSKMPNPLQSVGPAAPGDSYAETYDPGPPGETGSLIVAYDWKFMFPNVALLFGNVSTFPGIRRLTGLAVFRNEM